jgi:hypothetical protein
VAKMRASHAVGYFHCYLSAICQKSAPGPFSRNKSSDSAGRLVLLPATKTPAKFASVLPIQPAKDA